MDIFSTRSLSEAIQKGQHSKIEPFLKKGHIYPTCLHDAIKAHSLSKTIALLLRYKAEVNAKDASGLSPLHLASSEAQEDTVALLLNHRDAEINAKDSSGYERTPLHYAASGAGHLAMNDRSQKVQSQKNVIALLINHGADIEAKDLEGLTALHHAASAKYNRVGPIPDIIRALLSHGADIDAKDNEGNNILHHICQGARACSRTTISDGSIHEIQEFIGELVYDGARLSERNKHEDTCLDCLSHSPYTFHSSTQNAGQLQDIFCEWICQLNRVRARFSLKEMPNEIAETLLQIYSRSQQNEEKVKEALLGDSLPFAQEIRDQIISARYNIPMDYLIPIQTVLKEKMNQTNYRPR